MVLESNTLDVLFVKDGQQGEDGKILYTWIKYAKDASGTGITDDPNGAIYIGISYNNESSIESNDPTHYAWTKIQGADGKKGEDAYTIFLENENISFATDKNRNPLSEQAYTSGITIMKGAKPVTDFTIGDIAKTQGIAVAKTDTAIAISVVNGNSLPNDSGEIEIPITVGGTVFKKILTWTCAKKGEQGEKGERGLQGIQGPQGIQGVAGKDGTNGKTTYFHIKYSSVANPTSSFQLTETPSTYIGTYVDFAETDSTDPKKYTWSQFIGSQGPKGEQGIAGVGVDGKTSYLHIAYANSADGKTGFSVSDSTNKSYIGQYTDFTPNDSTDYTKYSWSLIRGKDGIDGVSPTVSVTKNGTTTTITITDKNGTHTQTVKDGTDGTPGAAGKDGKTSYFHVKYSNDGGKTFTGNSGEDTGIYMGSYTDYTEADSTDVKKYNWVKVKGDKGDTGQKGQDGTSVKITSKSVTYQTSTSGTTAPTGTWSTTVPTVNNGQYLWTKTTVQYSDGNKTEAYSVSYKGTNGTNGTSVTVSKTEITYQVSTSGTTAPTGTWSTTMPSCDQGQYLWTKTYVKYSDGKDTTSYSVSYKGVDGEKFAFNMLRETNQGSKHWVNMGASGKYSVESITTEDSINAVKLICTKPIASNEWQFCEFSDYEMLKSLKASTAYTLSYDIKTNRSGKISHNIKTGGGQKPFFANDISCKVLGNETWEHVSLKMTSGTTLPNLDRQVIYMFDNALSKVGYSIIKNLKLTEGIVDTPWAPHPEDLEGRGVSEIVQYYLATSQASGVTSSTSGWSTDITTQKLTADKKYLWNCSQTKYTDGTSEPITSPTIIGAYGDKGANALQCKRNWTGTYTTINGTALATLSDFNRTPVAGDVFTTLDGSSNTGTWQVISVNGSNVNIKLLSYVNSRGEKGDNAKNLSITPSSQYFKSTDGGKTFAPNQITITPTLQGEINFGKWQYSIDGGVSFADVVSGQSGLSVDANKKLTIAKTSGLFTDKVTMVTFRAVASDSSFYDTCSIAKLYDVTDIEIGGVNLIKNSNFANGVNQWVPTGITYAVETDSTYGHHIKFSSSVVGDTNHRLFPGISDNFKHIMNTTYTLSFYAKASANTQLQTNVAAIDNKNNYSLTTSWQKFTFTYKASAEGSLTFWAIEANKDIYLANIKLERGNKATDYTVSPEDVQTAILSTKNSIENVSSKVDTNTKSIQDKVSKTTYEKELTLVKGDLSKANEGLNKWRYEIYPKSLFDSEDQCKNTIDIFARNLNLVPSQTVLLDDASLSTEMYYGDQHIAYALTFIKMSAKKNVTTKMFNDDSASLYVNGGLISSRGGDLVGTDVTFTLMQGWNCLEVVVNEQTAGEGFRFSTTLSKLSECQMMNCYYGTPVARQSRITNQLVDVTKNLTGVTSTVQDVMTAVGNSGNITEFKNNYSKWKQSVDKIETRVGEKYVTNEKFNGLEIGGRNLLLYSQTIRAHNSYYDFSWLTDEVETFNRYPVWSVKNQWGRLAWSFKSHVIDRGLVKVGDTLTYSLYAKTNNASGKSINCSYRFKGNANAYWFNASAFNVGTSWARYFVTFTVTKDMLATDTYMNEIGFEETASMSGDDKVYYACPKLERGTKATDYTEAPEDNEINGQNLVSNLPSSWEQGGINGGQSVGSTYASIKSSTTYRIRIKDIFSVSGNITISAGGTTTNSSKETLSFYGTLYDTKKGLLRETGWKSFPSTINCGDAKYMSIILRWGDGTKTQITPSDISKICLKIERGTSATPFTLAPEDVNGKIQSVETIATQAADKFSWLVKSGTSSSNFELTDKTATLVASKINQYGLVTFNGLDDTTKDKINTTTGGNLITVTPANPKSDYGGGQTYNVTADDKGGRCVQWNSSCASFLLLNSYTPVNFTSSDQLYYDIRVPNWSSTTFDTKLTIWFYNKNKANITSASKTLTLKSTIWNHFTGYLTLPSSSNWGDLYYYIIGLTNPNKQAIGITNDSYIERVNSYATTYAKNAVDWVGQNGTNTNNMYSMISKWANGAVSANTKINGGLIETDSILAKSIAIGDFANYSQLNHATASHFGFTTTDDSGGEWFTVKNMARDIFLNDDFYDCKPGDTFRIEFSISTSMKGNSKAGGTDSNYVGSTIGLYSFSADLSQSSIYYAQRITASANATETAVSSIVTIGAANRLKFRVFLQTESYGNWSGTLKIRNVTVRKMTTGNLIVDGAITADKIATDAIKSRNYISSGGTQGSFLNLSDGSFKSPNLSWDSHGNLIAKNANLSGQITATKGKIGSFNLDKSLYLSNNSPYYFSQFCAKKVYGLTNEGDIYIGSEGIYSYSWETGNMYIGDSGSIQADVSSSRGVCIENGEIYIYKSDYCKDYPTACDNKYGLVLAGGYVASANYSDGGSIDGFNFILTPNKFNINGKIYASNELQTGGDQIRIISGNIGCMVRNDSADFYILRTNSGDPYGGWTNDRPFRINWASNDITCGHNLTANDLIANSWVYCSEVHSSGAVVIASNSESYYWAHGYQMARGTSWGGVCIGDDSQGLRLYGTSIWASHSISTSDENLKENFTTLDQYEDFYMNLNPIGFNYIGDYDGKKTHFGFGAHKTEDILESEGYDSDKFAVVTHRPLVQEDIEKRFGKDVEVDIETEYGVSYTEFIALNTHMIQKTRKELEQVKQEKTDLEARLQAIEAKLGL